jgi:electron transfer flavoprotein alpha subunit
MSILVLAEHDNNELNPATLNAVAAAAQIGGDIHILVAGSGCGGIADAAAKVAGVSKVLSADSAEYANGIAENMIPLIMSVIDGYSHLLAPATTYGKNILPGVAALKDVAQISDIIRVDDADTFQRPIYAGNALATVKSGEALKVITVRTTYGKNILPGGGIRERHG